MLFELFSKSVAAGNAFVNIEKNFYKDCFYRYTFANDCIGTCCITCQNIFSYYLHVAFS